MKPAYYNELDPYAAKWLRNLIAAGHIAPGDVDERSIEDVRPDDLRGYTQCHFFAGIGVWSYALRRAGWSDDRPVWTGSCPCQPFSSAGAGAGFADERHLWPAFHHLIKEHHEWCKRQKRKAPVIFGEQVASKDADPWIDLVQTDMETLGYAFGAVPFPSAGVGAPHIRDRNYWVADAADIGQLWGRSGEASDGRDAARIEPERLCDAGGLGYPDSKSAGRVARSAHRPQVEVDGENPCNCNRLGDAGNRVRRMADTDGPRSEAGLPTAGHRQEGNAGIADDCRHQFGGGEGAFATAHPGPINGYWRDADWLFCRDGKFRPVEPCTFPLAHGAAARVGRLRAYGNAINASAAEVFIACVIETLETTT